MDVDDHSNIIGQVMRCKAVYTFEHQNSQKIVPVFTNGLKFQSLNDIYSSSFDIIIVNAYNSSTKMDSMHSIQITLNSASPYGESVIQFGLNVI